MNETETNLPPRLSEKSFRRYEPFIHLAVESFPESLIISEHEVINLRPITFIARLRDAMTSFYIYNWPSITINRSKFILEYDKIRIVRHRHEQHVIVIGGKPSKSSNDPVPIIQPNSTLNKQVFLLSTLEQKQLICELYSFRLITNPITFAGLSIPEVEHFENNYDILITLNLDGTHTIK